METTYTDAQLRRLLLETLEKTPRLRRKALLERCVAQLDFSQTQLSDRTAGSPVIRCKSRIRYAITGIRQEQCIPTVGLFCRC